MRVRYSLGGSLGDGSRAHVHVNVTVCTSKEAHGDRVYLQIKGWREDGVEMFPVHPVQCCSLLQ